MSCDFVVVGRAVLVVCATVVVEGAVSSPGLVDDMVCGIVVVGREVDCFGSAAVVVLVVGGELVDSEVCGTAVLGTGDVVVVPVGTIVGDGEPVGNSVVKSINNLMMSPKKCFV